MAPATAAVSPIRRALSRWHPPTPWTSSTSASTTPTSSPTRACCWLPPCIRDLKAGVGLRHCPSGKLNANAAWLLIATLAHNLLRWIAQIGLGVRGELVVAKTLRRTLLTVPGRLTRSARRLILHLPAGWPWAAWFELALARLRCVAYAT
jgi:hypothetical protein